MQIETTVDRVHTLTLTDAEFLILLATVGRCPHDEIHRYFSSNQAQFTENERGAVPTIADNVYCTLHAKAVSLGLAK